MPITYTPAWYHRGDADIPGFAILYALLTVVTIWAFESLVERFLLLDGENLSSTMVSSLVTFKGSTWIQIIQWSFRSLNKLPSASAEGEERKISHRSFAAIFVRVLVVVVEVVLVLLAIPKTFDVVDIDVGQSQIKLRGDGEPLLIAGNKQLPIFHPCVWDKLIYEGFVPSIAVLVCHKETFSETQNRNATAGWNLQIKYFANREELNFQIQPSGEEVIVTHNMLRSAIDENGAVTYNLPLPKDIASQAAQVIQNDNVLGSCIQKGTTENTFQFSCSTLVTRSRVLTAVFTSLNTTRVEATSRKINQKGESEAPKVKVGTISRPRLCVYPFLILLGSILLLNIVAHFIKPGNNTILKLFYFIEKNPKANPLNVSPM